MDIPISWCSTGLFAMFVADTLVLRDGPDGQANLRLRGKELLLGFANAVATLRATRKKHISLTLDGSKVLFEETTGRLDEVSYVITAAGVPLQVRTVDLCDIARAVLDRFGLRSDALSSAGDIIPKLTSPVHGKIRFCPDIKDCENETITLGSKRARELAEAMILLAGEGGRLSSPFGRKISHNGRVILELLQDKRHELACLTISKRGEDFYAVYTPFDLASVGQRMLLMLDAPPTQHKESP